MVPLCLGFCCPSLKVVTFAPFYVLKPKFLLSFLLWHLKSSWKQGQAHSVCVQTALALVKTAKRPGEYVCTMYVPCMYIVKYVNIRVHNLFFIFTITRKMQIWSLHVRSPLDMFWVHSKLHVLGYVFVTSEIGFKTNIFCNKDDIYPEANFKGNPKTCFNI